MFAMQSAVVSKFTLVFITDMHFASTHWTGNVRITINTTVHVSIRDRFNIISRESYGRATAPTFPLNLRDSFVFYYFHTL